MWICTDSIGIHSSCLFYKLLLSYNYKFQNNYYICKVKIHNNMDIKNREEDESMQNS